MRWESWAEFWAMGGYALYVWGSVGVTALLIVLEIYLARRAHVLAWQQVRAQQEMDT